MSCYGVCLADHKLKPPPLFIANAFVLGKLCDCSMIPSIGNVITNLAHSNCNLSVQSNLFKYLGWGLDII